MQIESVSKYLRGFAILGVVVENYLSWIPINSSSSLVPPAVKYVSYLGASLVHLFFFLSGYGLTRKYNDANEFTWREYALNRFSMIVVPYWIVVIATYLFINILHGLNQAIFEASYRVSDVLAYVFFIRNYDKAAWGLNPALWFMQVIFGLYVAFPFLSYLMNKYGVRTFLAISALIAYSSRCIFWAWGYEPNRESSVFLFYIFEFAVGMAIARVPNPERIGFRIGSTNVMFLVAALSGYVISYILKLRVAIGANLHEVFTFVGSVALGLFCYQATAYLRLTKVEEILKSVGSAAFIIYLTHAPPIQHLIRPVLRNIYKNQQGVLFVCALLAVYVIFVFLISQRLAQQFKVLSTKVEGNLGRILG